MTAPSVPAQGRTRPRENSPRRWAERAESFCRHYLPHGRRQGRHWFAGGIHGAPGRSLWMCLAPPGHPGLWTDSATGQRGYPLELLRLRLGDVTPDRAIEEACAFLAANAAPTMHRAPSRHALHHRAQASVRLWDLCRPIHGSHAEAYLRARGLQHCSGHASLRCHSGLFYRSGDDAHQELPALVAAVTSHTGEFTGVQRTYLDRRRPAKANVDHPRKALGRIHGCAVYLGQPHTMLIVAQGIETALALRTARPDLAVAATLTEASLGAFIPPARITRLLVARDNDTASAHAAERLLARCRSRQITATITAPVFDDFNDDLLECGRDALAAHVHQAVHCLFAAEHHENPFSEHLAETWRHRRAVGN